MELAVFAYTVLLFSAVWNVLRTDADAVAAVRTWMCAFGGVVAIGVCEAAARLAGLPYLFWPDEGPAFRFSLTFDNNAQLANFIAPSAVLALAYLCRFRQGLIRSIALASLAGAPLVLLFASKRSVFAAVAISGVALLCCLVVVGGLRARSIAIAGLVLGGLTMLVGAHEDIRAYFLKRVSVLRPAAMAEDDFLNLQAHAVWDAFESNPFTGIGYAGFRDSKFDATGNEIHSTVGALLAETGIFGLLMYCVFMLTVPAVMWRALRASLSLQSKRFWTCIAALYPLLLVSGLYQRHTRDRTFWLLLAIVMALAEGQMRARRSPARSESLQGHRIWNGRTGWDANGPRRTRLRGGLRIPRLAVPRTLARR